MRRTGATTLKPLCLLMIISLVLAVAGPVGAATKIQGYYEGVFASEKQNGKWHVGSPGDNGIPQHFAELKFLVTPSEKFEVYSRIWARSNRDDGRSPEIDYYAPPWYNADGHIKMKWSRSEAILFYRQNQFYINDEPLLRLVDDGKLRNGDLAQGVRFDFRETDIGLKNLGGTVILSDNGGTFPGSRLIPNEYGFPISRIDDEGNVIPIPYSADFTNGEDSKIVRLRHKSWADRIEAAVMYTRKDWTDDSQANWRELLPVMYNDVFSYDLAFSPRNLVSTGLRLGPINLEQSRWTTEMAWSRRPYREAVVGLSRDKARAIASEQRDIHIWDFTLHSWYYDFGEDFRSTSSSRFDEGGEYNKIQKHKL
mgnify:FL=1